MSKPTSPIAAELPNLDSHPALAETASKLFYWAAAENDAAIFLRQALPLVAQTLGGEYLALVHGAKGQWRTIAASGPQRAIPTELLAESLDRDEPVVRGDWHVGPLAPNAASGELLVAYRTWNQAVERGGFSAAARTLLMTPSAVSNERSDTSRVTSMVEPPFEFRVIDFAGDCLQVETIAAIPMPDNVHYDRARSWVPAQAQHSRFEGAIDRDCTSHIK
jgi:hypothetical protein